MSPENVGEEYLEMDRLRGLTLGNRCSIKAYTIRKLQNSSRTSCRISQRIIKTKLQLFYHVFIFIFLFSKTLSQMWFICISGKLPVNRTVLHVHAQEPLVSRFKEDKQSE